MDKNKIAQCYRRGVEAMEKQNWDLAVAMFTMCAKFVADNVMYRQLLRQCEMKKYKDNGSGAGKLAKGKLIGIRGKIKKARAKEAWDEMDQACEEGLALNPWDVQLNVDLSDAARQQERLDVARFGLQMARKADPNNKDLNLQFAELLEERGEYDEAATIWQHICKLDPNDGTARSRLTGAHTRKTLDRGGYNEADSTKNVMTNKQVAEGAAAPGESEETDLKQAIRKEPDKYEHYLKLADFYKRAGRLEETHQTLTTALEVSGNDPNVRERFEDTELAQLKENLELAREKAAGGDAVAQKNAGALAVEYNKRRLDVLSRRVERHPQDLNLKFELATVFMLFQKWPQAIPLLQQASKNQRLRVPTLVRLGKCFIQDKKLALAKAQLKRAVEDLDTDDPKLYCDAHYSLGWVCEELGETADAENHYGEVLVVEYEYKDALQRLEKLQSGGAA